MFKAFALLSAFFAVMLLSGCSGESETFTVGFDPNFPPYGYRDKGEFKGFDLDLAREVARRNHWKIVLKPINWDDKDTELNSGAVDCIWNGFTINGRETAYEWSEPYVDNSQVVIVPERSPVSNLAELAGQTVAVQSGSQVQKTLSADGARANLGKTLKQIVAMPDLRQAAKALEAGSVDAVALDIGVAAQMIRDGGKFRILPERIIAEKYGIGFKKGSTARRNAVQKTLKEMVADGTAAKISKQYFDGRDVLILKP